MYKLHYCQWNSFWFSCSKSGDTIFGWSPRKLNIKKKESIAIAIAAKEEEVEEVKWLSKLHIKNLYSTHIIFLGPLEIRLTLVVKT